MQKDVRQITASMANITIASPSPASLTPQEIQELEEYEAKRKRAAEQLQGHRARLPTLANALEEMSTVYCNLPVSVRDSPDLDIAARRLCDAAFAESFHWEEVVRPIDRNRLLWRIHSIAQDVDEAAEELKNGFGDLYLWWAGEDGPIVHSFETLEQDLSELKKAVEIHIDVGRCRDLSKLSMEDPKPWSALGDYFVEDAMNEYG